MKSESPKIESRKCSEIYKLLKEFIPHYTPEWAGSDEKDPGVALLKVFSHMTESVVHRFNQAPQKNFVAFLDMLGIKRLPAQPSRAPVTFMLAKGLEKDILIPERTQVAADKNSEHDELPFETENSLLAISSQLKKVAAFDPAGDAIYVTPRNFLDPERKREAPGNYRAVASALAFTKHIQLDRADGLEEKDFLKIGEGNACEYKEIKKKNTTVIEVTDEFKLDFPAGTPVEKVTKFNLFEGKDMQEHCVYIAHKDFFNVKSPLKFTIYITHRAGTGAGITPLDVSWEYWGEIKTEDGGGKGEGWHKFDIDDDKKNGGTDGLSKSGIIKLSKTTQGEIKEREINGEKNRWIRCKLNKNLTGEKTWKLPELDNIQFQVGSGGPTLNPDLAFFNDTEVNFTQRFKPFGDEPKLLDTFAIASKEVFSKKGAKIELAVTLEQRGIFAAPTAISFYEIMQTPSGPLPVAKIRVFAMGTDGRLIEVKINPDGTDEVWDDHGSPANTEIDEDSIPSAVTNSSKQGTAAKQDGFISVFLRAKKSHLIELFYNSAQWNWKDQEIPEGVDTISDPYAVYDEISGTGGYKSISAFVTGSNGSLYEFNHSPGNMAGSWIDHGKPDNTPIASPPHAQSYSSAQSGTRVKVFVNGKDGLLYELDCKPGDKRTDKWTNYYTPKLSIKLESRPFAVIYPEYDPCLRYNAYYAKVFVKGDDGNLWKFNTRGRITKWVNLNMPPDGVSIQSAPHGHLTAPDCEDDDFEGKHIFIRGSDNHLWEVLTVNENGDYINKWRTHKSPGNSELLFSPILIVDDKNKEHIFSVSNQHSIIERRIDLDNPVMIWNEYNDPNETSLVPALSWEYWNKKSWLLLKLEEDETKNLLKSGIISFYLPDDIEEKEIAGQKSYWIRARIVSGDYGKATYTLASETIKETTTTKTDIGTKEQKLTEQTLTSSKQSIRPPIINKLKIGYELGTKQYPEKCLTYNNLDLLDQTEVSKIPDKFFKPFMQMEEKSPTVYLGFENYFKGGPVRIFFDARELRTNEETKPKLNWTYSIENGWNELSGYCDYTEGLVRPDLLEFIGSLDFRSRYLFGESRFWIKGTLTKGDYENDKPVLNGIYPNTTWALQAATIKNEKIGSSDGNPDQVFSTLKIPVLERQDIRVRELLSEEERQDIIKTLGKPAIKEEKDEKGKITETWVSWAEVSDFFGSDMKSRHYTLDRATGQVQFGNGINGMIPPKGDDNIKSFSYQTGGGAKGNVSEGEIKSLKTSVPGVEKVWNPVAADGGADAATIEQMLEVGPAKISHRTRAVTREDFEWLARKASRKVIKARCLPNTGKANEEYESETGRVTVIIVPGEKKAKPVPSLQLKRDVRSYLEKHCANTLSSVKHVYVDDPRYAEVNISVDVHVISIDVASQVERDAKKKLDDFFHPLTGGMDGKGWDFGRSVSESDVYALLENIDGVDHIENLGITITTEEEVSWESGIFLVANGKHTINTMLKKERAL